jgi:DNA-binding IclR family transcriptional regulator
MTGRDDSQRRMREILSAVAARGATVTYRELAGALGFEPPGVIRRVAALLEESMIEDARAGRPFLAAVVVSQADGVPRRGCLERAAALGRFRRKPYGPGARAFFRKELAATHSYWKRRD